MVIMMMSNKSHYYYYYRISREYDRELNLTVYDFEKFILPTFGLIFGSYSALTLQTSISICQSDLLAKLVNIFLSYILLIWYSIQF